MKLLKKTRTRCPECLDDCDAHIYKKTGTPEQVIMQRSCPTHGTSESIISSDARFYWLSTGQNKNQGDCCSGNSCANTSGAGGFDGTLGGNALNFKVDWKPLPIEQTLEKLSTCLALIEIVDSCNLACPTCFAESPTGTGQHLQYKSLDDIKSRIDGVIERKGSIEILQLSGGEPTLHPDFFELIDWLHAHPMVDYTLVNTNGVRLVKDANFFASFQQRASRPDFQFYLQFDGVTHIIPQKILRGGDLRSLKKQAMDLCEQAGLSVTLAMTVIPENIDDLWEVIQFGLKYDCCRGVSFQPMFQSGRFNQQENKLNTADVVLACLAQSNGKIKAEDFTPLPCGDPNCSIIGYLLKTPLGVRSISDFVDFKKVQGFLKDKVKYQLEDLQQCGCENEPLGEMLKQFEMKEKDTFRLFIKPFMDEWSWDEDRIDRCCTHVIRPDGKLDSFCRYYSRKPNTLEKGSLQACST